LLAKGVNGNACSLDERVVWTSFASKHRSYRNYGDEVQEPDPPITVFKVREEGRPPGKSRPCAPLTLASVVTFLYRTRPLKMLGKSKCWKHP